MEEYLKALKCLYLEVPKSVADDIFKKINSKIQKLELENKRLSELVGIKKELWHEYDFSKATVKCDEENNFPTDIMDSTLKVQVIVPHKIQNKPDFIITNYLDLYTGESTTEKK